MSWTKHGLIYAPRGQFGWNLSHAQVPTVDVVDDRVWRIYYSTRDADNKSWTSFIEVEAENPSKVLYEHPEPILPLGRMGTFDDSGIMPSCVVRVNDSTRYLYYVGWTTRQTVPYHNSIGLAVSRDGGRSFAKLAEGPLFGPTLEEPYFTGTSCVLVEGDLWRCWYLSAIKWEPFEGKPEPFYDIKYAESDDGIRWRRGGQVAVSLRLPHEAGLVPTTVLKIGGRYQMWYGRRNLAHYRTDPANSYRIGYAESPDGIHWERMDSAAGIDLSSEGWDSMMISYPHVVIGRGGRQCMFYNGNGFGRTGFGYATRELTPS
ncbi:MAG TPA: hypothetical protein VGI39_07450 [Polyangiaceae bacterium]|jgi:hypothetical protein